MAYNSQIDELFSYKEPPMQTLTIGIDPDITKSGVAVKNSQTKSIELMTLSFYDVFRYLEANKENISKVFIEASWLINKSSWHSSQNMQTASKIGIKIGLNHGTGINLANIINGLGIPILLKKPLAKKWGFDRKQKISHLEIERLAKLSSFGIKKSNQEQRDALLLIM